MTTPVRPRTARCPRCSSQLVQYRSQHYWCVCGFSDEPADPRDITVDYDPLDKPGKPARPSTTLALQWTEAERALWEAYDRGEEIPSVEEWDRKLGAYPSVSRGNHETPHGEHLYRSLGCRCGECVAAHRQKLDRDIEYHRQRRIAAQRTAS